MSDREKILVILTGGTICSEADDNNENQSNAKNASKKIISFFKASNSPFADAVDFDTKSLSEDILSENMTVSVWNELIDIFRDRSIWTAYKGIIILHGTDTLAYTSSLLSFILAGAPTPVCMVSAQLDLSYIESNGHVNFRASVELIMNGIAPNVYVVYRNMLDSHDPFNSNGKLLVHYGSHILQCANYNHNFYSEDAEAIIDINNAKLQGRAFETDSFLLDKITTVSDGVMLIQAYVGLKYSRIDLGDVKAVVHGSYHSDTVCVERKKPNEINDNYTDSSILYLLKKAKMLNIPVVISPCNKDAYTYTSTGDALRNGAFGLFGTTLEAAYVKCVVGVSLGLENEKLIDFLGENINFEFVYGE
ncbi:MAG: asparaginase [Clostridia bacterium]|nr:asparaginase [Clostridia bacterium]